MSDDSHTEGKQWRVQLDILSNLKPTELAIMLNMFPGVVDARVVDTGLIGKPANQPPKDNQIDIHAKLVEIILGKNGDAYSKSELILAALATAIREATPGQLTEFHGQGTMQLEAKVHQAAIDQFLTNLKDIGLEV